jgi:hypothetical protein
VRNLDDAKDDGNDVILSVSTTHSIRLKNMKLGDLSPSSGFEISFENDVSQIFAPILDTYL